MTDTQMSNDGFVSTNGTVTGDIFYCTENKGRKTLLGVLASFRFTETSGFGRVGTYKIIR